MISAGVSSEDDLVRAGHHIPHCAVGEQVLEGHIQCSVLLMESANVVMSKPSHKDILLPKHILHYPRLMQLTLAHFICLVFRG